MKGLALYECMSEARADESDRLRSYAIKLSFELLYNEKKVECCRMTKKYCRINNALILN